MLVEATPSGYRGAEGGQLSRIASELGLSHAVTARLPLVLAQILDELTSGNLAKAQLLALGIPLGMLSTVHLERLAKLAQVAKAGFNPDEPRNHGEWTREGEQVADASSPSGSTPRAALVAGTAAGASALSPEIAPLLVRSAALAGSTAALAVGFVVVPLNRSNVAEGTFPNLANLQYRYDEGQLTLSMRDDDGDVTLFKGFAQLDGLYRSSDGQVIGRDTGAGIVLDPQAIPALATQAVASPEQREKYERQLRSYAETAARSQPRLCPDPSRDRGENMSIAAGMCQSRVCDLPPNWGVEINGARFDGCDFPTGIPKECKGMGYGDMIEDETTAQWKPWLKPANDPKKQMDSQATRVRDKQIWWFVADPEAVTFFRNYAAMRGYSNVIVIYTPPTPEEIEARRLQRRTKKYAHAELML
jgi:hypothetical protein